MRHFLLLLVPLAAACPAPEPVLDDRSTEPSALAPMPDAGEYLTQAEMLSDTCGDWGVDLDGELVWLEHTEDPGTIAINGTACTLDGTSVSCEPGVFSSTVGPMTLERTVLSEGEVVDAQTLRLDTTVVVDCVDGPCELFEEQFSLIAPCEARFATQLGHRP